jgi:hypothetical protein
MKSAIVMALCATVVGAQAATGQTAQAANAFCAGLNKAVTPHTKAADAVFIGSYEPGTDEATLPAGLATTAFVYDNALAAIALIACGNVSDARPIANALSRAVRKDRSFDDGRVRNAYRTGAVNQEVPDLPGWWDGHAKIWAEDPAQDGTSTGNVAWVALALLTLHQATHDPQCLADARRLIDWVIDATASSDGFYGGFHGYDPKQVRLTWKSTEHNADVHAAARWLFRLTGEPKYDDAAGQARRLLDRAFRGDHFLLGTKPDGNLADEGLLALDAQLWPWMALPESPEAWKSALGFAKARLGVDGGFDFNGDRDGLWVEGTAQAALAYRISGNARESDRLLASLKADQTPSGLLNASRPARLTTGLSIDPTGSGDPDFFYYRRPHLGATAWAVLAETGWNPFTGKRIR